MLKCQKNSLNYSSKNSLHTFSEIMLSQKPYYTWQMVEKSHVTLIFLLYWFKIHDSIENTTSCTIFLRWIALFMSQSTSSSVRTRTSLTSLSRVVFYFHTSCRVPHLTIPVKYFEAITSSTAKDKDRFWKWD